MLSIAFDRVIVLAIVDKNPSRMIGNTKNKKVKVDFRTFLLRITKTLYYKYIIAYKFIGPNTQTSIRTLYLDSDTLNKLKTYKDTDHIRNLLASIPKYQPWSS